MVKYDVFISYNGAQITWVRKLVAKLREAGIQPFFDEEVGLTGRHLQRALAEGVFQSRCCVVILTPESTTSKWVGYEIQKALYADPDSRRQFIIPVLLKDCDIPTDLSDIVYIDCRTGMKHHKFEQLLKAIRQRRGVELRGVGAPSHRWWLCGSPLSANFMQVLFVDSSKGWIVGERGTILYSMDGGRSWITQDSGTNALLYSIALQKKRGWGWIVGEQGILLETQDGGQHWKRVHIALETDFLAIDLCGNREVPFIVGRDGLILRGTENGNWDNVASQVRETLWDVYFSPRGKLGCIVGANGVVLISENGGFKWQRKRIGTTLSLYGVDVLADEQTIWVVGDEGMILVSKDRGQTWQDKREIRRGGEIWLNTVAFSGDGQTGWISGNRGTLFNTIDGGGTWSLFHIDEAQDLVNVMYQDNNTVWIVGYDGLILTTREL